MVNAAGELEYLYNVRCWIVLGEVGGVVKAFSILAPAERAMECHAKGLFTDRAICGVTV